MTRERDDGELQEKLKREGLAVIVRLRQGIEDSLDNLDGARPEPAVAVEDQAGERACNRLVADDQAPGQRGDSSYTPQNRASRELTPGHAPPRVQVTRSP